MSTDIFLQMLNICYRKWDWVEHIARRGDHNWAEKTTFWFLNSKKRNKAGQITR